MEILGALLALIFLCNTQLHLAATQQCVQMRDKPHFAPCAVAGYNTTFPIPPGVSKKSVRYVGMWHNYVLNQVRNCSVAQIAETVGCALYAPYCKEGSSVPLLPCRRVCAEALKRCEGTVSEWWIDDMVGRCVLLPNETAASGKCYEPSQFTDLHIDPSVKGPFDRGCQKLVNFPFCENLGYEYTLSTADGQAKAYRFFYAKNLTDGDRETPAPRSIIQYVTWSMGNHSKCAQSIKKVFCGSVMAPCFPNEGKAYYSVCQDVCKSIGEQCPEIFSTRGGRYYVNCEHEPPGVTSHGFCKHTTWPPPQYWKDFIPVGPPTVKPKSSDTTGILVGVLVPTLVILIVLTSVVIVLWKQNKFASMFSYKRYQDTTPASITNEADEPPPFA